MEHSDTKWLVFTLPTIIITENNLFDPSFLVSITIALLAIGLLTWWFSTGGPAWKHGRNHLGCVPIHGPVGLPIFGSIFSLTHGLAHRTLASMASSHVATQLMAFSLGSTPIVVSSEPHTAREILTSPHFANRPVKQSAKLLMLSRAIGFAPNGSYWRLLRKVASSHLFAPKRILAHGAERHLECAAMLSAIENDQNLHGFVVIRKHLQAAALNNIMSIVFGKRYDFTQETNPEAKEIQELVREGFELLGDFNWSDHLPWLKYFYDPFHIEQRCLALVSRVQKIVKFIIAEHRNRKLSEAEYDYSSDFVDVLLSLTGQEKLDEDDMVSILWEMVFRGTDTTALLTEWVMAELIKSQDVQAKLHKELSNVVGCKNITDEDVPKLPYLEAVIKETLRLDPPGPLLSWSRLSLSNVSLSNGMIIPENTTAMVNMWAISRDPNIWEDPLTFRPERFLPSHDGKGVNIDVRGNDLRLAPFGAGRRVCPGKNLGLATVSLWVAKLVQSYKWVENMDHPVDLTEVLKLSSEMKNPLSAIAVPRMFVDECMII
ncbi:hypothetical protein Leryth_027658 [Lithospermum erythrorhizon]|nr:hypothetical protein Leryth_027658 [Lithospermum erythrorhizon]